MAYVSRYLEPQLVEKLNNLQLSARRVVEGATIGQHRSPLKGASVEFRQHRIYAPGDEPRRLDWRVLGRTDRPYIKEYDEETNLRCMLLLDASGSMAYAGSGVSKFEYGAKLAASLAYLMLGQTEAVGLGLFSKRLDEYVPAHAGTSHLSRLIDLLERANPAGHSELARSIHEVANRLERRSLVVLISDLFTPVKQLRDGMAHLHHDRHETIVLRVIDRDEETFPFKNWSRFRGMEGEKPTMMEPAMARKQYLANFAAHRDELQKTCSALNAEFATFRTDEPLIESVTKFLHRRSMK